MGVARLKNVLLVEADLVRADALARVLQPAGLVVTPVSDGERALTKARAAKPDLFVWGRRCPT